MFVSDEVFAQAHAVIKRCKNKGVVPKNRILFAGKIRCGHCNRSLRYQGGLNAFHFCAGPKLGIDAGCSEGKVYVEDLKAIVLAAVKTETGKVYDERQKRKKLDSGSSLKAEAQAELKQAQARVTLLERRTLTLYEDYAKRKLDRDGYILAKDNCADELSRLKERIEALIIQINSMLDLPESPGIEPLLRRVLDAEDVTDEVLSLVDCVVMHGSDRIEIRFAFGDTNTVVC